jgi:hypothetical protein
VFIIKVVKVLCFHTLLQVFILKVLTLGDCGEATASGKILAGELTGDIPADGFARSLELLVAWKSPEKRFRLDFLGKPRRGEAHY